MKFSLEFPYPGWAIVPKSALSLKQLQGARPYLQDSNKMLVPVDVALQVAEVSIPKEEKVNV